MTIRSARTSSRRAPALSLLRRHARCHAAGQLQRVALAYVTVPAQVIFVGEAGVGKTAMLERLSSNRFEAHTQPTIGTDVRGPCKSRSTMA